MCFNNHHYFFLHLAPFTSAWGAEVVVTGSAMAGAAMAV